MEFRWSGSRITQRGALPQPKDEDPTNSWPTDDRDSVYVIRVDSRNSRSVLFLPANYANERESKSVPRRVSLRSGRSSEFRIANCAVFRPRHLGTDYKVRNAPPREAMFDRLVMVDKVVIATTEQVGDDGLEPPTPSV